MPCTADKTSSQVWRHKSFLSVLDNSTAKNFCWAVSNISCGAILEGKSGFVIHFLSFIYTYLFGLRMKSRSRDLVFSSDIVGGEC